MIPDLDPQLGALPPGRYATTMDELAASSLVTRNDRRTMLFEHWQAATSILRQITPVCQAWIGGSYLTDKSEPGDIDCVYVLEVGYANGLPAEERNILQLFASGGRFKQQLGLLVDSYILTWTPIMGAARPMQSFPYHQDRGYWDELWSKKRVPELPDQTSRFGSIPRRGYLEVTLDGFPEIGPRSA